MTNQINFWLSVVSIVVTIISIICSIIASISAKKARQYKEETLNYIEALDIHDLLEKFRAESQNYQNRTRKVNWYKGKDTNLVISPLNTVLLSFGKYYHLMSNETEIKSRVHSLQNEIQNYTRFTSDTQITINNLITEITELLQEETRNISTRIII